MSKRKSTSPKIQSSKTKNVKPTKKITFNSNYIFLGLLIAISILVFIIRLNYIDMPMERDEGHYALNGKLILEGGLPYKDMFEQKPPGLFYSYALVQLFTGTTVKGIHIGFIFVNILTLFFLGYGLKYLLSPISGALGAMTFGLMSLNPLASGFTVQAEHLLCLFVAISFFSLVYAFKKEKLWALILSGASVAWATTIKQNGIFFILAIVLGVLFLHLNSGKLNFKQLIKEYIYLAIGGIGMAIIVVLAMLIMGVWDGFIFWVITYPRERYVSTITLSDGIGFFKTYFGRITTYNYWTWWFAAIGGISLFFTDKKWGTGLFLLSLGILSFLSITPGYRFYGHYWIQWFLGISILCGAFFYFLEFILTKYKLTSVKLVIPVFVFFALLIYDINKNSNYYFNPNNAAIIKNVYGTNPFNEIRTVAEFLKTKNLQPDDGLFVLGSEPQLHFETGLNSPTPYTFIGFAAHPKSTDIRERILSDLRKNEAKYLVMVFNPFSWTIKDDSGNEFFQETYRHALANYDKIGVVDMFNNAPNVYKWNEEAESYRPSGDSYLLVMERR